jgi:ubiquinone biosynthesis protein Coq4
VETSMTIAYQSDNQSVGLTLEEGLKRYYQANPEFVQGKDFWVGWIRIPWCDMHRHDIMHIVTGYSTELDQELQLIGFLLTAITWRRPWYYYLQSFGVFLELLGKSMSGKSLGSTYYNPLEVCRLYFKGVAQGSTVRPKINAYIAPHTVLNRPLQAIRAEYGIHNAGAWD